MKLNLNKDEIIINAQFSNFFPNGNGKVKGKLILTNYRILFKSFNNYLNTADVELKYDEISDVSSFNTMKFIPNGLNIITKDRKRLRFQLKNRADWMEQYRKLRLLFNYFPYHVIVNS